MVTRLEMKLTIFAAAWTTQCPYGIPHLRRRKAGVSSTGADVRRSRGRGRSGKEEEGECAAQNR
jgi:hypothetical protein